MTLEDLLRAGYVSKQTGDSVWPDFCISIQIKRNYQGGGVRVLIRAIDADSDTLDFVVVGNELRPIPTDRAVNSTDHDKQEPQ